MMTVKDKSKESKKYEINFRLRNVSLSLLRRNLISRTVERKWTLLLRLSKDVLDCQLEDGRCKLFRHNFNSIKNGCLSRAQLWITKYMKALIFSRPNFRPLSEMLSLTSFVLCKNIPDTSLLGILRFSVRRERAMEALFDELKPVLSILRSPDEVTFAQQCLKKNLMASPHDIRGARRLSVIFSLMEVKVPLSKYPCL